MASIIRSPDISLEKRKLTTRRSRDIVAKAVADAFPAPVVHEAAAPVHQEANVAPPHQPMSIAASLPAATVAAMGSPAASAPVQPVAAPAPVAPAAPEPDVTALVEQARKSVLEQFKADAEKARELGRQRGLQEGRLSGAEEARKSFEGELERIRSIADNLHQAVETQIHGMEDIAVSIAFEAMCRVLGETAVTREGILALVRKAASHAVNTEKVVARLHPGDLAALRETGGLDETLSSGVNVSWAADESVVLGGCIVETDSGELDARLETQMERLRAALVAARRTNS